jgi:hypothetical protein
LVGLRQLASETTVAPFRAVIPVYIEDQSLRKVGEFAQSHTGLTVAKMKFKANHVLVQIQSI